MVCCGLRVIIQTEKSYFEECVAILLFYAEIIIHSLFCVFFYLFFFDVSYNLQFMCDNFHPNLL